MPVTAHRPKSALRYSKRPPTTVTSLLSPFLLELSALKIPSQRSSGRHHGTWLHTPVTIHRCGTPKQALSQALVLYNLRHPNLEQFLGLVANSSYPCIVTSRIHGQSLAYHLKHGSSKQRMYLRTHALDIALDVARGLLYLHKTADTPHGSLGLDSVILDEKRARAVVLVGGARKRSGSDSRRGGREMFKQDVYDVAVLLVQLCGGERKVPEMLQELVGKCLRRDEHRRPSMESLCRGILQCCAE